MIDSIIGVDCATQARKVGLARAVQVDGSFRLVDVMACSDERHPVQVVLDWLQGEGTVLLALDAPLGWPVSLGRELSRHSAGQPVRVPGELLFRRVTDRVVKERTGKTPLDVGADRIARTAHWALLFLDHLRVALQEPIPLAWGIPLQNRVEAIEVYPAATLLARGGSLRGYKETGGTAERERLLDTIVGSLDCESARGVVVGSSHCLDALVCVVAALDFLSGTTVAPADKDIAEKEGWIWFKDPAVPL